MRSLALLALAALPACEPAGLPATLGPLPPVFKTAGGVEMVHVPAGEFEMGSERGKDDERPVHKVKLDAFLMDRTEVTQAEYERLGQPNPAHFKGAANPVEQITWAKAAYFCNLRSRAEGLEPCYNEETGECDFGANGYRLPTEAEWEYASRAGARGDYSFGSDPRALGDHAWFADNSGKKAQPVGRKRPNAWGLHDLHGNVMEWCNDVYQKDYYAKSPAENPRGPAEGEKYVLRGGAWNLGKGSLRSSYRVGENPGFADACFALDAIGFRCVRNAPQAKKTALVYSDRFLDHKTGEGFPESPARLEAIVKRLKDKGLWDSLEKPAPRADAPEWIAANHSADYVQRVRASCAKLGPGEVMHLDSRDVPVSRESYDVAVAAVAGVLGAVDAVAEGKARNAFCAVRPPGHHALPDRAMGFCLFNNVAIAARYVQKKHKLAKVLIVDWDVHHGNGTQDVFYEDGTVMYFSTHLSPFYPGSGAAAEKGKGKGEGLIVNVPLPAEAGDDVFKKVYEEKLKPAALAFKPDFVLISAGFDSHKDDLLGRLGLSSEGYGMLTRVVKKIAEKCARGRIVSMLEGGYNLDALGESVEHHIRALME